MSKIPNWLDNFIYNELKGEYRQVNRQDHTADFNLYNDILANKRYIGTYFPRSLMECFKIFSELNLNPIIKQSFSKKENLKILDIGTGTGGNILGLLFFLNKICFESSNVEIYTIEGNKIALDYQKRFVDRFNLEYNTSYKLIPEELIFTSAKTFKDQLTCYLMKRNFKFDIITSFKFFSEFYNQDFNSSQGILNTFIEIISNFIENTGILVILDVLNPNTGREHPFMTQILSAELNSYIKSNNSLLNYIIPVCCAKWNKECYKQYCYIERKFDISHSRRNDDISKVGYRIMSSKNFSSDIITSLKNEPIYKITHTNPQICNYGIVNAVENINNIADAFKLS